MTQYLCAWAILSFCQCVLEHTRNGISGSRVNICNFVRTFNSRDFIVHLISVRAGCPPAPTQLLCFFRLFLQFISLPWTYKSTTEESLHCLQVFFFLFSFFGIELCLHYFVSLIKKLVYEINGIYGVGTTG